METTIKETPFSILKVNIKIKRDSFYQKLYFVCI